MKLIIYFPGTGESGEDFIEHADVLKGTEQEVKVIFAEGCHHPDAGAATDVYVDLDAYAKKFVAATFTHNVRGELFIQDAALSARRVGVKSALQVMLQRYPSLQEYTFINEDPKEYMLAKQMYIAPYVGKQTICHFIDKQGERREMVFSVAYADIHNKFSGAMELDFYVEIIGWLCREGHIEAPIYQSLTQVIELARSDDFQKDAILTLLQTQIPALPPSVVKHDDIFVRWSLFAESLISLAQLTDLAPLTQKPISHILLGGYSRGAVTCPLLARALQTRQLQALAPLVPVSIIAREPVPGNAVEIVPGTNAYEAANCASVFNVMLYQVFIGAYTGEMPSFKKKEYLHKVGFSQVISEFSHSTRMSLAVIPRRHHWQGKFGRNGVKFVMKAMLAQLISLDPNLESLLDPQIQILELQLRSEYNKAITILLPNRCGLPKPESLQRIYGLKLGQHLYHHIDSDNPFPSLIDDFAWYLIPHSGMPYRTLLDAWNDALDQASVGEKVGRFLGGSSPETEALVAEIISVNSIIEDETNKTQLQNYINPYTDEAPPVTNAAVDAMRALYRRTDLWLAHKTPKTSSRYSTVEALHRRLYFYLQVFKRTEDLPLFRLYERRYDTICDIRELQTGADIESVKSRPSASSSSFFSNSSQASVAMLLDDFPKVELYQESHRKIVADICDNRKLTVNNWIQIRKAFSPTAQVIIHAIFDELGVNPLSTAEVHTIDRLGVLLQRYVTMPLPLPMSVEAPEYVREIEAQFQTMWRQKLAQNPLLGCSVIQRTPSYVPEHSSSIGAAPLQQPCSSTSEIVLLSPHL